MLRSLYDTYGTSLNRGHFSAASLALSLLGVVLPASFILPSLVFSFGSTTGCLACAVNLVNFWCALICSPHQGTFASIHDPPFAEASEVAGRYNVRPRLTPVLVCFVRGVTIVLCTCRGMVGTVGRCFRSACYFFTFGETHIMSFTFFCTFWCLTLW